MPTLDVSPDTAGGGEMRAGSNSSWAAARGLSSANDGVNYTASQLFAAYASNNSGDTFINELARAIMSFDLLAAGIPAGATINSVILKVKGYGVWSGAGGSLCLVAATPASTATLAASDFSQLGSTDLMTRAAFSGLSASAYNNFTLNTAGKAHVAAAAGGVVKFGFRASQDVDNSAPSFTFSGFGIDYGERAGTSEDPILTVDYTPANVAVGRSWDMPYLIGNEYVVTTPSGSDDGEIRSGSNASYNAARVATAGTSVDNTSTTGFGAYSANNAGDPTVFALARGYLTFDTSPVADAAQIINGDLWLWCNTKWDTGVGGTPALCLVAATQSSPLVVGDLDLIGATELAARVPLSGVASGSWIHFVLNAAGRAAINKTGVTKFAVVLSHDLDNVTPTSTKYAGVNISYSRDAAAKRPRLGITSGTSVGRSWDMPYGMSGAVGRSWPQPYAIDSARIARSWQMPYLIYNFRAGTRTARGTPVILKAAGTNPDGGPTTGWNAFPSMVRVPDVTTPFGRTLVAWWQGGGQRVDYRDTSDGSNGDGNAIPWWWNGARVLESLDLGTSWGGERQILAPAAAGTDTQQTGDCLSRISIDPVNGDIIHVWYSTVYGGPVPGPPTNSYAGLNNKCHSWMRRSSDGGNTWTTPVRINASSGYTDGVNTVVAVHSVLILRDGTYLMSVYGSEKLPYADPTSDGTIYTRVLKSTDRGVTWAPFSIPFPKGYNYDGRANPYQILAGETSLVELDTGRILAIARVQNAYGAFLADYWTVYSDDKGATWSTPVRAVANVTNLTAMKQTVAGDIVMAGADLINGVDVYQSKDRGASWSLCFNVAFASGTGVGADFIEVTGKDAEDNLLFIYGEEHWQSYNYGGSVGISTIADQGWIKFQRMSSAVTPAPTSIAGAIGRSWDQPYKIQNTVGRSWAMPYKINAAVGRSWSQPYTVFSVVGRSWAMPYSVGNPAGRSWAMPYGVAGAVGRSWGMPYAVGNFTAVGRSWAMSYAIMSDRITNGGFAPFLDAYGGGTPSAPFLDAYGGGTPSAPFLPTSPVG